MEKSDYLQQLSDIKNIIEKSTKFKALSGFSGILAGIYALVGAFLAYRIVKNSNSIIYYDLQNLVQSENLIKLLLLALTIFFASLFTGLYFSAQNAKKHQMNLWTPAAKKVLMNFGIPMLVGGIFAISVILKGYLTLISPICLLFYGLALLNAANYTFNETKILGYAILLIGCISLFTPGLGLYLWALGFGVFHIIYGVFMYNKYEK
jgi:hypothetical protein